MINTPTLLGYHNTSWTTNMRAAIHHTGIETFTLVRAT